MALFLRLGDGIQSIPSDVLVFNTVTFMLVSGGMFLAMRLYRGIWRYSSLQDLLALMRAITLAIVVFVVFKFALTRLEGIPRSTPFILWFVLLYMLGGARLLFRILREKSLITTPFDSNISTHIILAGAGDGAELFLRSLRRKHGPYKVVGIISQKKSRVGRVIHDVSVMGTFHEIDRVVRDLKEKGMVPCRLVLTSDALDGDTTRNLLESAERNGMMLARIPRLTDFKQGKGGAAEIRPVDVEDLLGREQRILDRNQLQNFVSGRKVLVTGAGGSIGAELVRQISELAPGMIGLLDNSEYNLYAIDMEVRNAHPDQDVAVFQADVRDRDRVFAVLRDFVPDIVFHAAALKHVPMVELNPGEGVLSNVVGTVNVADACRAHSVQSMVLISTDKAVNPTNIMGATKRIAEQYCQALDMEPDVGTYFVTVRFGNVLGSTGSVVPLFQKQLARGGPLTVTHPDITRYFMTIREAVGLVLQASYIGSQGQGQEGKVFVLDMGTPVKIEHIARQMIRLQGLEPGRDVKIEYTGLRPGEKLYEEIFHDKESMVPTSQPGLLLSSPRPGVLALLQGSVAEFIQICRLGDVRAIRKKISDLVPEYTPDNDHDLTRDMADTPTAPLVD